MNGCPTLISTCFPHTSLRTTYVFLEQFCFITLRTSFRTSLPGSAYVQTEGKKNKIHVDFIRRVERSFIHSSLLCTIIFAQGLFSKTPSNFFFTNNGMLQAGSGSGLKSECRIRFRTKMHRIRNTVKKTNENMLKVQCFRTAYFEYGSGSRS